jgi:hypothetical protein
MLWIGDVPNANAIRYAPGSLNTVGWSRGGVVNKAIEQIYAYTGGGSDGATGLCGGDATNLYGVDISGDWCSETAAYILRNGGASNSGFSSVSTVSDMQSIFTQKVLTWIDRNAFTPTSYAKSIEPGDYLAMHGSAGDFGHSGVVVAVADDLSKIWTVEGNVGNPRCLRYLWRPYLTNGQLNPDINAIGKTSSFLPLNPAYPATLSGTPWGYTRPDNKDVVVAVSADKHVREYTVQGDHTVSSGDLTWWTGAPLAAGDAVGYARHDQHAAVLYRGTDSAIYEMSLYNNSWYVNSLSMVVASATGNVPPAASDPVVINMDASSVNVFRATSGHLYGFVFFNGVWGGADIHAASGATVNAVGDPAIYKRSDGRAAVVYRGTDNHIYEIAEVLFNWWAAPVDITAAANAPAAAGDPAAYFRPDGWNCIVYRTADGRILEIATQDPTSTTRAGYLDLTNNAGALLAAGDPTVGVRSDGVPIVTYRAKVSIPYGSTAGVTTAFRIEQLSLGGGQWWSGDVSSAFNLPAAFGRPRSYSATSGRTSTVFFGARGNIHQFTYDNPNNRWTSGKL